MELLTNKCEWYILYNVCTHCISCCNNNFIIAFPFVYMVLLKSKENVRVIQRHSSVTLILTCDVSQMLALELNEDVIRPLKA